MARRTKEEKFNIEVEAALEAVLDFDFNTALENSSASAEPKAVMRLVSDNTADITDNTDNEARDSGSAAEPAEQKQGNVVLKPSSAAREGESELPENAADKKMPAFPEGFFSFKRLAEEEDYSEAPLPEDDIFDIKTLEQQIASAAKELNKYDEIEKLSEKADKANQAYLTDKTDDSDQKSYTAADGEFSAGGDDADHVKNAANSNIAAKNIDENSEEKTAVLKKEAALLYEGSDKKSRKRQGDSSSHGEPPAPAKKTGFKYSLKRNPLYWTTATLSALWVAGGFNIAYKLFLESGDTLPAFATGAQSFLIGAGTIVPVLMFWAFAQLARRTKELQHIVRTVSYAAQRLLDPEPYSEEKISGLGHTIRREVSAMEIGIDRTMARASELEALLQSEVNNLERSYGENEVRIRSLIAELANEREAVATHADNVKAKITGAKDRLTQEFSSIADHINATAESFTIALSETLNSRWGELVGEFNNANEEVARQLSQKFIDTVQGFDASRGQFFTELDRRFLQIDAHTDAAGKAVAERLGNKMDDFVKIVQERTESVEGRFDAISLRLADSGNKIIDSVNGSVSEIEERTQGIEERLQSTADKVLNNFDTKFRSLDDAVIDRGNRSLADFSEQIDRMENRAHDLSSLFDDAAQIAETAFEKHMGAAEARFRSIAERFNHSGAALSEIILQNMQQAEKRGAEMDARLAQSSKSVVEVFENKFNALDNLFVDRSNRSLNLFADQIQRLEQKSANLSTDFESATQISVQQFEERLNEVDNLLSHKSSSLIRSFIDKTEDLEKSTEKLNSALEIHVERVNEAFNSRAGDIAESLTNGRNDILSIVDETKTRLSHEMEIVGTTIGKLVDERAGGFIYQFIEGREKLSHSLQQETGRIIGTVSEQISRLSAYVADIEKNLSERVRDIDAQAHNHMHQLNARSSEFENSIINNFGLTRELIETQAQNIDVRSASLRDSLNLNSKELNDILGQQTAVLEERINAVRHIVANSDTAFTEAMRQHIARFDQSVSEGDAELKEIFLKHLERLQGQTGRLKETFNSGHAALSESLDGKIASLQTVFTDGKRNVESLLEGHGTIISEHALHLQNNLAQTLAGIDSTLNKQGEILDKRAYDLRDAVDYNSTVLSDSFTRQTAIIDERAKTMQKTLEISTDTMREALEENIAALSESLRKRVGEISSSLNDETHKAENIIAAATNKLLSSVFDSADNVDQKLANRGLAIGDMLRDTGSKLENDIGLIETRLTDVTAILNNESEKTKTRITDAGNALSSGVAHAAKEADKVFSERGAVLQNNLQLIEGRLNYGLESIQEHMLGTASEIEQKLSNNSLMFKDDLQKMTADIGGGIDAIRERVAELTHNTTEDLVEKTNNLFSLTEQLKNAAARTSDSLANLSGTFSKQLQEVTQAAEERLRQENESFISNFSGHTDDAVFAVQNAKTELEKQVNRLLESMENSNSSIQLTVGSLHDNVNEVDKKLGGLTSDFKQNITELSENFAASGNVLNEDLQRFNLQSQDALENIAKFSEQFDAHANLLTEATESLENSNTLFSEKLEAGQESLNALAGGLVTKSDEIADVMHNCERVISSVIQNLEEKTWSSTTELRSTLSALINEAAGRFEGATEDIRRSAGEIREELERTQSDLNRGMRGLPAQTKEYTDAMRKAVMDQVEALKDLSGIVEETGMLFDVSKPQEGKSAARIQNMRAARGANGASYSSSANGSGSESQSSGWVSNLLARASKEDNTRLNNLSNNGSAYHNGHNTTLNAMSADIVQAIDRNAIASLWQHYRRGQQNIAADRLYTPDGYRVFEDIKQKYTFDGDFRRAVGQYITDFEHLLGDVTKNGGNNGTVRDYLTSDTGKVYTMLAHVSGRIQ